MDRRDGEDSHDLIQVDSRLLGKALTIRRTEERLLSLFAEGKLFGTVHTCIGQEWIGVAVAEALQAGDFIFSNHRGHGHYLARTDDVEGLIAELMGRSTGVCGGRGGSQHLCRDRFFSNGVQGGIVPVAAGLAMSCRMEGGSHIAVAFIGDGTLGQGVVYETLNIAAHWSLPLLIVLEDNGIAQSTPQTETLAGTIKGRAHAFGIDVRCADTWHPSELFVQASQAVRQIRQSRRPLLLHVKTYRCKAHSKGDDDRDREEVAKFVERDTLSRIIAEAGAETRDLLSAIDHRLDEAVARASAAPFAECSYEKNAERVHAKNAECVHEKDAECVYEKRNNQPSRDRQGAVMFGAQPSSCIWKPVTFAKQRVVDAIRKALTCAMADDERIVLLGEDVCDPYGGAFKVTAGLSERFEDRVHNTPISEPAIVGIANGLALARHRPVVEIMFSDFLLLAADQFANHAAKFSWMYNDQVQVPIVVRSPSGGYRGYGPTHSQCLEKHLLGVPGTRVLAIHKRFCPGQLYRTLLADNDRPTLVVENKLLYGKQTDPVPPSGCDIYATDRAFPTIRIKPDQPCQLTVVTYGGMVEMVESAIGQLYDDEELACDLLIPTQLYPLDIEPMIESVQKTGRLLVVEEAQGFAGFAGELIAQVACDHRITSFQAERVSAAECPIPTSKPAEADALPGIDDILAAAVNLVT